MKGCPLKNPFVKQSKLDDPIDVILEEMKEFGPGTTEYEALLDKLERMSALQSKETWTRRIDPTQVAAVAANLAGIVTIVHFEKINVLTSKAVTMLHRTKTQP